MIDKIQRRISKKYFFVLEVNPVSYFFLFCLSLIKPIYTRKLLISKRLPLGAIKVIDYSDYFSWEDIVCLDSEIIQEWEKIEPTIVFNSVTILYPGCKLDFSHRLSYEYKDAYIGLRYFNEINRRLGGDTFQCIASLVCLAFSEIEHIRKLRLTMNIFSLLNIICETIWRIFFNILSCFKRLITLMVAMIGGVPEKSSARYFWDGISPSELSNDCNRKSFSWIIDGVTIKAQEVFFFLPKPDFQIKVASIKGIFNGLRGVWQTEKNKAASKKEIARTFIFLTRYVFLNIWTVSFDNLCIISYCMRIFDWLSIVNSLKPNVYVSSISNVFDYDPISIFFQSRGIKVIVWTYGCYHYYYLPVDKKCDYRNPLSGGMMPCTLACWNLEQVSFLQSHVNDQVNYKMIGPLMCGDEKVMIEDRSKLCNIAGIPYFPEMRYIVFFDSPVEGKRKGIKTSRLLTPHSIELNTAFIFDVCKLLDDFKDIILIYKPKRSLTSKKFAYSESQDALLERIKGRRFFTIDYNINPWIPIAIADICISIPFESPTILARQYGKIAIFHDPLMMCQFHRFPLKNMIMHGYEELKNYVGNYGSKDNISEEVLSNAGFPKVLKDGASKVFRNFLQKI
jgi:polysaccharide biosynthesis PFTS motif protein